MENSIFILIVTILGLIILIILWIIERHNKKELEFINNKKKVIEYYLYQIKEIGQAKEEEKIEKIGTISKKLFNDYYNLNLSISYSELVKFFETQQLQRLKEFSEIMLKYYYKDNEIDKNAIKKLLIILKEEVKNMPLQGESLKIIGLKPKDEELIEKENREKLWDNELKRQINIILIQGEDYLKFKMIKEAVFAYNEAKKRDEMLKKEDEEIHTQITEFYNNLASKIKT